MQHTYLRYECADAFSLSCSSSATSSNCAAFLGSSRHAPAIFTAGSQCIAFDLRKGQPCAKIGHREPSNIGTGRALNSSEVTCIDTTSTRDTNGSVVKVATGWVDGSIRIFEVAQSEIEGRNKGGNNLGLVHSLLDGSDANDEFACKDPLVLNGHGTNSPIRCVVFDKKRGDGEIISGRLASGGSDGSVVVWDIVAETGLFRLLGHKGAISHLSFASPKGHYQETNQVVPVESDGRGFDGLISGGLDGLVKVWDLDGQCCVQTLTGHRSEVWSADCTQVDSSSSSNGAAQPRWRLVTGASDAQLRVWAIHEPRRTAAMMDTPQADTSLESNNDDDAAAVYMGSITRETNERVSLIKFHPSGKLLGVLAHNTRHVEVYAVRSLQETKKRQKRRLRRRREKAGKPQKVKEGKKGMLDENSSDDEDGDDKDTSAKALLEDGLSPEMIKASDELELVGTVRGSHKIKGFSFAPFLEHGGGSRVVLALATNAVEVHLVKRHAEEGEPTTHRINTLDMHGHPTGIRGVSLSSDETLASTISKGNIKVWNVANRACIRSLPLVSCEDDENKKKSSSVYGLCCAFLPGNAHVVVGTREGTLQLIDIASGNVIDEEPDAHEGAIWALDVRPDGAAMVTGSADNQVKFWEFERDDDTGTPCMVHTRTLKMSDDVVAVRYSYSIDPEKRLVCISSLDCTIKIFFDDSLKFFLNLYGHKLPALALDCADDDTILASGGADKSIKIWGLDFGDTHRTLHGHEDSITDLKFVRRTHNFFTCSKDKTVRYWDADKFEQILLMSGHSAEVNCMALSRTGGFLMTCGMDRQVRVWERTKDMVFIDEEKERQLEKMFDQVDGSRGDQVLRIGDGKEDDDDNEDKGDMENEPQSEAAVKRSVLSVAAGDRIMEAIELADQEMKDTVVFKNSRRGKDDTRRSNPMLLGMEPAPYMLWVLRSVKAAELEQSLLILPINHMERLAYYLIILLRKGMGIELCAKVAVFLVKIHQNQIVANQSMAAPLRELQRLVKLRISESRDMVGFNLAALRAVARIANEKKNSFIAVESKDIWAGLGLGSDEAAALGRKGKRQKT